MSSKKSADFLSLLVASRQVFLNIFERQTSSAQHYARTSSIPRAVGELWRGDGCGVRVGAKRGDTDELSHVMSSAPGSDVSSVEVKEKVAREVDVAAGQPLMGDEIPRAVETQPEVLQASQASVDISASTNAAATASIMQTPPPTVELIDGTTEYESPAQSSEATPIPTIPTLPPPYLKQSRVPSTRASRLWHYGSLAATVGMGAVGEAMRRATGLSSSATTSPILLTPTNIDRIVSKLTRMRGAALKLGQMLSIQDSSMLPKDLETILLRVQNNANYMPDSQLQQTLKKQLGANWQEQFDEFELIPIAAASIGQVHRARLHDGRVVAVKVQYPGVANSIDSDLDNLRTLILFSNFLPKGLYLDNTIRVARKELAWECDYEREADAMIRFKNLISSTKGLSVPAVIPHLSTRQILTTEFVNGVPLSQVASLPQHTRDNIATRILTLCFRELFEWKYMQTDPNWSNFFYEAEMDVIHLLDFGAARSFSNDFTTKYMNVLHAASIGDREGCTYWSQQLGFLTGMESAAMTSAHVNSLLMLAEPFSVTSPQVYDFGNQDVTSRVRKEIPVMLRERLTPPPEETYSLHRKLSGAFLLCAKLGARVRCREVFEGFWERYR